MKVLITFDMDANIVNGVAQSAMLLKKHLLMKGHEVKYLTLSQTHHSYVEDDVIYVAAQDFSVIYPGVKIRIPLQKRILEYVEEWKPDVIHTQCGFSTFQIAMLISKTCECPIVHTVHTLWNYYTSYLTPFKGFGDFVIKAVTSNTLKKCQEVIVPTEKTKQYLRNYGIDIEPNIIPSGIDVDYFTAFTKEDGLTLREKHNIPKDAHVLVSISRIAKEKNLDELICFFDEAADEDSSLYFVIVGDGPYKDTLEKEASQIKHENRIVFTGMIKPELVPSYYRMGDLFVSASTSESQGLTYVEALASGIPALCRKDPVLDLLIQDGFNGWQWDGGQDYLDYLKVFFQNPKLQKNMSDHALESVKRYNGELFADSVVEVYERAIAEFSNEKK